MAIKASTLRAVFLMVLTLSYLAPLNALGGIVPKPITFIAGQHLPAASLNIDFDALYNEFNGFISNPNIAPAAAIVLSKLDLNAPALSLQPLLSNSWGAGVTGDPFARITLTSDGFLTFGSGAVTQDIAIKRSAVNTLQLFVPGGGTPILNMGTGNIVNAGTIAADSITLTSPLAIAQGGTGAITAAAARTNLIAAKSGANSDITSLSALSTPLSIAQGGTAAITAAAARASLSTAILGANNDITSLSALSTPLSVPQGGTGSGTASGARSNLSAAVLGANNDITSLTALSTPLPLSEGGTGLSTAQGANKVLGYNAGNTAFEGKTVTAGTGITVVNGVGTVTINSTAAATAGFGGSGADGNVVQGSATESAVKTINATQYVVTGTYNVVSGTVINCTAGFTDSVTALNVLGGMAGGAGIVANTTNASNGAGVSGGDGSHDTPVGQGGGGGGCVGAGGQGSSSNATIIARGGAGTSSSPYPFYRGMTGSGGGGGEGDGAASGGNGGTGGGNLTVCSVASLIINAGTISAVGVAGGNGGGATNASGGGGGSGGVLGFFSQSGITQAGGTTITVAGGAGGNAGGGTGGAGGGGGGGGVLRISPTNTIGGTTTVSGGAAGTGGTGVSAATAGAAGIAVDVTGNPALPLIVMFYDNSGWMALGDIHAYRTGSHHVSLNGHEFNEWLAAFYAKPGKFEDLRYLLTTGEDRDLQPLCDKDMTDAINKAGKCSAFESRPNTCLRYIGDLVYSNEG